MLDYNIITPIEKYGDIYVKRDDTFNIGGGRGGKVRSCWVLSQGAKGLVTAGSRSSPQVNIVAQIAKVLNIPCRCHVPTGELYPEVLTAKNAGAEIIQHKYGYNSVIIKRAKDDAIDKNYTYIPFGMECEEAVTQTSKQVINIPDNTKRILIPVGSGMSLAGVLTGLELFNKDIPVLGVMVGANPIKRLNMYAPPLWQTTCELVISSLKYSDKYANNKIGDLILDPIYEAKCIPYLEKDDLLWVVGIRGSISI